LGKTSCHLKREGISHANDAGIDLVGGFNVLDAFAESESIAAGEQMLASVMIVRNSSLNRNPTEPLLHLSLHLERSSTSAPL
jgi:hypothetical protein